MTHPIVGANYQRGGVDLARVVAIANGYAVMMLLHSDGSDWREFKCPCWFAAENKCRWGFNPAPTIVTKL